VEEKHKLHISGREVTVVVMLHPALTFQFSGHFPVVFKDFIWFTEQAVGVSLWTDQRLEVNGLMKW
jgi:hypothetical protein